MVACKVSSKYVKGNLKKFTSEDIEAIPLNGQFCRTLFGKRLVLSITAIFDSTVFFNGFFSKYTAFGDCLLHTQLYVFSEFYVMMTSFDYPFIFCNFESKRKEALDLKNQTSDFEDLRKSFWIHIRNLLFAFWRLSNDIWVIHFNFEISRETAPVSAWFNAIRQVNIIQFQSHDSYRIQEHMFSCFFASDSIKVHQNTRKSIFSII